MSLMLQAIFRLIAETQLQDRKWEEPKKEKVDCQRLCRALIQRTRMWRSIHALSTRFLNKYESFSNPSDEEIITPSRIYLSRWWQSRFSFADFGSKYLKHHIDWHRTSFYRCRLNVSLTTVFTICVNLLHENHEKSDQADHWDDRGSWYRTLFIDRG